jgi:beta-xylosidase
MLPLRSRRGMVAFALTASAVGCADEPIATSALDPGDTSRVSIEQPLGATHYQNPVYAGDFADPFVLLAGTEYFGYATNTRGFNVPVLRSDDLIEWRAAGDALPRLPSWAETGRKLTWAPSVIAVNDHYVLLFTARDYFSGLQCVGRAESGSPAGPFIPDDTAPFICQVESGGSIDASVTRDSTGQAYVIWKNDGNCCDKPVALWGQRLSEDGRTLVGSPTELLRPDQPWEGPLIEGPTMWQEQGTWHLLYSANRWNSDSYATGYAACASPLGPCQKALTGPLLMSDEETAGPGGAEAFTDVSGRRWLAYHAWNAGRVGYSRGGVRSLRIDRVRLAGAAVLVLGPTTTTQSLP